MNLNTWLFQKGVSKADFARILGISRTHMSLVIHKRTPCGRKLAERIELHTGGAIKAVQMKKGCPRGIVRRPATAQLDAFDVGAL